MEKPLQLFSDEYLEECRKLTPDQIVRFLDQYRYVAQAGKKSKTKLISIKIPEELLGAFKFKAQMQRRPYQSIIKELMIDWIQSSV